MIIQMYLMVIHILIIQYYIRLSEDNNSEESTTVIPIILSV